VVENSFFELGIDCVLLVTVKEMSSDESK